MGIDTLTMRRKLLKAIGEDETDTTLYPDALLLLNQSFWNILDSYPFREKEKTVRFETIAGTTNYNMPEPFEAVQNLSIEDLNSKQHSPLKKMDPEIYEERYQNTTDAFGKPEAYVRENCFAKFLPTPDAAYTIILKYWTVLDDLNDTNTPGIPQAWHEIILYGGIWRGFLENGDIDRASAMRQHTQALINGMVPTEAKEERDTRFAGLQPFNYRSAVRMTGRGMPRGRNGFDEF